MKKEGNPPQLTQDNDGKSSSTSALQHCSCGCELQVMSQGSVIKQKGRAGLMTALLWKKYCKKPQNHRQGRWSWDRASVQSKCFCRWKCGGYSESCSCRRRTSFLTQHRQLAGEQNYSKEICDSVMCFFSCQTKPLSNLWQPKDQYLLICTGLENRKGSLKHRALSQMKISSRIHKILSYLLSSGHFTPALFTMIQLFYVSCGQILLSRFHKVMISFTRVSFTFEVGGILKTLLGFFNVYFGDCS